MENQLKTLKEHLEEMGALKGDDRSFVIIIGFTEMRVSRRYLESKPMKYFLDKKVIECRNRPDLMVEFELEDSDS